jgi:hypothetical protein
MLLAILFAASLQPSPQVSLECANIAAIETQPVPGPGGVVGVLKVTTEDDHSKNSHQCNADYQLLLTSRAGDTPRVVDLLTSNDDYGRSLSPRLAGFSQDGKRVLGMFSEKGKHSLIMLFDYHTGDGTVQLVDVTKQFAPLMAASCSATLAVIGTTESGAIVLELNATKPCASSRRWVIDSSGSKPRPVSPNAPFLRLYTPKVSTP